MKVVKHAHHGTIFRLPNEDAHLLVSSGRYVYSSKFEARKVTQRQRPLWLRIGMFVTTLAAIITVLLLSTSARAADLKVPYKVCLTQAQAAQVHPGKHLKYREVGKERCWYAGKTLPKHAFKTNAGKSPVPSTLAAHVWSGDLAIRRGGPAPDPRPAVATAASADAIPLAQSTQDTPRVQGQASLKLGAGASLAEMAEDAFLALTGQPEAFWTFDAYWDRMTGWNR